MMASDDINITYTHTYILNCRRASRRTTPSPTPRASSSRSLRRCVGVYYMCVCVKYVCMYMCVYVYMYIKLLLAHFKVVCKKA